MKVAIFGGSFNPPHVAHVLACTLVLSLEDVDALVIVPTYRHPFAKALEPFDDRVAMCGLAMGWLPGVEVSRVEEELGGESRTLRTVQHLRAVHPDWRLRLVIGADVLSEAPRWFGFDEIAALAPPIVLARAGVSAPETAGGAAGVALPEVSSTRIRALLAAGDLATGTRLLPRRVLDYIRERGLYGVAPGAP
ncbi:MAG: nicotinate (nicotinamide) nucleotide adenylyltransferase [Myxococcales bacterium]|nr:nicotinate (nicotinamide) nucleotide adenylyltransferase [Myxococcales bacterium]